MVCLFQVSILISVIFLKLFLLLLSLIDIELFLTIIGVITVSNKSDWYLLEFFNAGELYYPNFESSPTFIVDTISRDGIIYFRDGGYLLTPETLELLKDSGLTGVNINEPDVKFSMQHNMKHPNQKIPTWYRMVPFFLPEDGTMREVFLDSNRNLIVSARIKDVLMKAHEEKRIRLKRVKIYPYENKHEEKIIEENKEQEVFDNNKENPLKGIIIFVAVMALIAYWFFK